MTRVLIRVNGELSNELQKAFPQLSVQAHREQSTLTGEVPDQEALQGVLHALRADDIDVIEVVTIPD
ncbi:hypothetical protein SAMN05428985_104485 [Nocardioides sp. YR527]|uniref:hypothetical protein n=1 Tax=Nocardioides sp. YR527 TaxID=1881028 RepID=UPI0008832C72|nr:hypothetical protein [Nocardioides sp. YR527]SDK55637.1 hypothetical protein SAMN05428985_104485 [Nocardioides sp. YR527]